METKNDSEANRLLLLLDQSYKLQQAVSDEKKGRNNNSNQTPTKHIQPNPLNPDKELEAPEADKRQEGVRLNGNDSKQSSRSSVLLGGQHRESDAFTADRSNNSMEDSGVATFPNERLTSSKGLKIFELERRTWRKRAKGMQQIAVKVANQQQNLVTSLVSDEVLPEQRSKASSQVASRMPTSIPTKFSRQTIEMVGPAISNRRVQRPVLRSPKANARSKNNHNDAQQAAASQQPTIQPASQPAHSNLVRDERRLLQQIQHSVQSMKRIDKFRSTRSRNSRSITVKEIALAIPRKTSSIFHIMDRRVDMDNHKANASTYSLLRSWVQDDPFRKTLPIRAEDILESSSVSRDYDQLDTTNDPQQQEKPRETLDMIRVLRTSGSDTAPSMKRIRRDFQKRAVQVKQSHVRSKMKAMDLAKARLKGLGIDLDQRR